IEKETQPPPDPPTIERIVTNVLVMSIYSTHAFSIVTNSLRHIAINSIWVTSLASISLLCCGAMIGGDEGNCLAIQPLQGEDARRFHHPNHITQIFQLGSCYLFWKAGNGYLASPSVENISLEQVLHQGKRSIEVISKQMEFS